MLAEEPSKKTYEFNDSSAQMEFQKVNLKQKTKKNKILILFIGKCNSNLMNSKINLLLKYKNSMKN